MRDISDFIGNYRILAKLTSHLISELYIVEDTFHSDTPALLLLWPSIKLSTDEDRATFLQKSNGGIIQPSGIAILDAGVEDQHPYITVAYSEQAEGILRRHLGSMAQALQATSVADNLQAQTETFLRIFTDPTTHEETLDPAGTTIAAPQSGSDLAEASTTPLRPVPEPVGSTTAVLQQTSKPVGAATPAPQAGPVRPRFAAVERQRIVAGYRRLKLWQRLVLALLIVALVCWGSFALYTHVPAQTATITIVPVKKTLNQLYTISVNTGGVAADTIQGRKVSFTSSQHSQTVAATGKGHHDATKATGNLVVTQIHLNGPASTTVGLSTLTSLSGVSITTKDEVNVSDGGSVTQHAEATQPGSGGNIGAYDINFPITIVNVVTNAQVGTGYATNPDPFTGGNDASDFTFVQQSDIDKVTTALSTQLTPDARAKVTQQIKQGERMADDIQCTPNSSSNHKANDQSSNVTVTLSMTCAALVYNEQALHQAAIMAYKTDGQARFGQGYDVVGDTQMDPPVVATSTLDVAQFAIHINGVWTFQWTPQHRKDLQNVLAGKPQDDAMQLLGGREDIKNVSIAGNWFPGNALPANPDDIKLVIK